MIFCLEYLKSLIPDLPEMSKICDVLNHSGNEIESSGKLENGKEFIEVGITANRGDLLSYVGLARELSALLKLKIDWKVYENPNLEYRNQNHGPYTLHFEQSECERYSGTGLNNIKIKASPDWLVSFLEDSGIRSINNVVDITNFILLFWGQPMHAFDADYLTDKKISVALASKEQEFVTLDEKTRKLNSNDLLILSGETPVALAGIMGGANSEIRETSGEIFLECAIFPSRLVQKTSRKLDLITDSSYRFARKVNPNDLLFALNHSLVLLEKYSGAQISSYTFTDFYSYEAKPIHLNSVDLAKYLGPSISLKTAATRLTDFQCEVQRNDDSLIVISPKHRQDLFEKHDLIEEIARYDGFESIEEAIPGQLDRGFNPNIKESTINHVKSVLIKKGYNEAITYSFQARANIYDSEKHFDDVLNIANPLSEQFTTMRQSIASSLLTIADRNFRQQTSEVKFFEFGRVYGLNKNEITEFDHFAVLWSQNKKAFHWQERSKEFSFYEFKKDIVEVLESIYNIDQSELSFELNQKNEFWKPNYSAKIFGKDKALLGTIGEIAPKVLKKFDLNKQTFCMEIVLPKEFKRNLKPKISESPRFFATRRDLSLVVDEFIDAGSLITEAKASVDFYKETVDTEFADINIENCNVFDFFKGKNVESGKKIIGLSFSLRSLSNNVGDERANKLRDYIVSRFNQKHGITLRDN